MCSPDPTEMKRNFSTDLNFTVTLFLLTWTKLTEIIVFLIYLNHSTYRSVILIANKPIFRLKE